MGCQRENDRKSYHFLFGTFFDRGVHFEKQRRYEENGTLTVREIALCHSPSILSSRSECILSMAGTIICQGTLGQKAN